MNFSPRAGNAPGDKVCAVPARRHLPWDDAYIFRLEGIAVIERLQRHWRQIRREYESVRRMGQDDECPYPIPIFSGAWLLTGLRTNPVESSYFSPKEKAEILERDLAYVVSQTATPGEIDQLFDSLNERQMAINRKNHPTLSRILDPLYPHSCVSYCFSVTKPGTRIKAHRGSDAGHIRVHLCLKQAQRCWLKVGNQVQGWRNGETWGFDDSSLHSGANEGVDERIVVIADFTKAYLARELRRAGRTQRAALQEEERNVWG